MPTHSVPRWLPVVFTFLVSCAPTTPGPQPAALAPGVDEIDHQALATWEEGTFNEDKGYVEALVGESFRGGGFLWVTGGVAGYVPGIGSRARVWRRPEAGGPWEKFLLPEMSSVNHMNEFWNPSGVSINGTFKLAAESLRETALGRFTYVQMLDVDLTAQTFTTGPYDPDHQVAYNGWVVGDEILSPWMSRTGDVTLRVLALSTGTFTDWAHYVAPGGPHIDASLAVPMGPRSFAAFSIDSVGRLCRSDVTARIPGPELDVATRCAGVAPAWLGIATRAVQTSSGPRWLWVGNGRTFSVDVLPGRALAVIDLGPGTPVVQDFLLRPPSAHLVAMQDTPQSAPHFVDIAPDGVFDVAIPLTPCATDSACLDRSELKFLVPLDAGAWFVVHLINLHTPTSTGGEYVLTGRTVTPARTPRVVTGSPVPPPSAAPLPEHPEAVPANDFVIACDQLAACTRENFARDRCLTGFSQVQGGTLAQNAAYQALMTAAASGCAALKTIDATVHSVPCSTASYPNRPGCQADQQCVVPTSGAPYCAPNPGPWACNTCDANGNAIKCSGLSPQEVVPCGARGMACSVVDTVPTCVIGTCVGPTTAGLGTTCDGDRQVGLCANGAAVYARDCTRTDSTCQNGACAGSAVSAACTDECVGDLAVFCVDSQRRFFDCAARGWGTCSTTAGFAACTLFPP